jgi:Domain of unknown function (DUF3330)
MLTPIQVNIARVYALEVTMLKANISVTTLACEVCLREIPHSVGRSCEGQDYVHYYCGDACYSQWTQAPTVDSPVIVIDSIELNLAVAHALR